MSKKVHYFNGHGERTLCHMNWKNVAVSGLKKHVTCPLCLRIRELEERLESAKIAIADCPNHMCEAVNKIREALGQQGE